MLPAAVLLAGIVTISWAAQSRFAPVPASTPQVAPLPSPAPQRSADLPKHGFPEFFVMIDPSHGGEDRGALLAGNVLEKDVTLSFARDLRRQLEERGISARLLRDSDRTLSLNQRAELTNEARPSIYVALHAGSPGSGVRVYTSAITFPTQPEAGRFLSWESAQAGSLDRSRSVARVVAAEIRRQDKNVNNLAAPLRPLNNLVTPAIAVELAVISRSSETQKQQNAIASAVASGIAQVRGVIGVRP